MSTSCCSADRDLRHRLRCSTALAVGCNVDYGCCVRFVYADIAVCREGLAAICCVRYGNAAACNDDVACALYRGGVADVVVFNNDAACLDDIEHAVGNLYVTGCLDALCGICSYGNVQRTAVEIYVAAVLVGMVFGLTG